MGRPLKVTPKVKEAICEAIANGAYLMDVCKELGVNRSNVYRATTADAEFGANYDRAYTFAVDAQLEEATSLLRVAETRDQILKADKLVNAAQWKAEKRSKQYQPVQKQEVAHHGYVIGWEDTPQAVEERRVVSDVVLDVVTAEDVAN